MSPLRFRSAWGWRTVAGYLIVLSAAAGFTTYHLLFHPARTTLPGSLLVSLGLPWSRLLGASVSWPMLVVSMGTNLVMLYFIGSRFEQLASGEPE